MKIEKITNKYILFDNGNKLSYEHEQDCCEDVYADFMNMQVVTHIFENEINISDLDFNEVLPIKIYKELGFTFESLNGIKILVSCYDSQNGYYSSNLKLVYYDKENINYLDIEECEQQFID